MTAPDETSAPPSAEGVERGACYRGAVPGPLRFGPYELLFRVASGGMAEVFAARREGAGGFERLFAIKRMVPHLAENEAFVRMFLDEARVAVHVDSPHVVATHDLGRTDDGALYIALELVVGVTLAELVADAERRDAPLPLDVALEVLAQAADGLHDAHEAKTPDGRPLSIVHRDVSPQNVLVGVDGRAKVSDFGVATAAVDRFAYTEPGQRKGKWSYFSPEQSRAGKLDRRSDVFALGVVAWEAIAGRRLFTGPTPAEVIIALRTAPIPPLEALRPDLPAAAAAAIARALERDVDRRLPTAAALAAGLRAGAREAGLAAGPARVAAYLEAARLPRVESLRARLRACGQEAPGTAPAVALPGTQAGTNAGTAAATAPGTLPPGTLPPGTLPSETLPPESLAPETLPVETAPTRTLPAGPGAHDTTSTGPPTLPAETTVQREAPGRWRLPLAGLGALAAAGAVFAAWPRGATEEAAPRPARSAEGTDTSPEGPRLEEPSTPATPLAIPPEPTPQPTRVAAPAEPARPPPEPAAPEASREARSASRAARRRRSRAARSTTPTRDAPAVGRPARLDAFDRGLRGRARVDPDRSTE